MNEHDFQMLQLIYIYQIKGQINLSFVCQHYDYSFNNSSKLVNDNEQILFLIATKVYFQATQLSLLLKCNMQSQEKLL